MHIVGVDLSLTATGFCYGDGSTETLSSPLAGMDRIRDLRDQVLDRLDSPMVGRAPALVVIEDYAFSRGGHAHEIGELGGVVKDRLIDMGQTYALVGPSALKKFATGKGVADKVKMAVAASKLGREFADDNQCDAWWLWQTAMYRFADHLTPEQVELIVARNAYRDEAVSKVPWPELAAA